MHAIYSSFVIKCMFVCGFVVFWGVFLAAWSFSTWIKCGHFMRVTKRTNSSTTVLVDDPSTLIRSSNKLHLSYCSQANCLFWFEMAIEKGEYLTTLFLHVFRSWWTSCGDGRGCHSHWLPMVPWDSITCASSPAGTGRWSSKPRPVRDPPERDAARRICSHF